jgi:hypothetical protein
MPNKLVFNLYKMQSFADTENQVRDLLGSQNIPLNVIGTFMTNLHTSSTSSEPTKAINIVLKMLLMVKNGYETIVFSEYVGQLNNVMADPETFSNPTKFSSFLNSKNPNELIHIDYMA